MKLFKKLIPPMLILALALSACQKAPAAPYDPDAATKAVLESGAFSVALEELDTSLLFDFEGNGIDPASVTSGKSYSASGLTEQVSVLVLKDGDTAAATVEILKTYLADLKESYKTYAPAEVPKLDAAILDQRGSSVLLVVANDAAKAQAALDGM
ncbi:MAG: DUF4358 domain-containing protein [Pseudoflavonifractor sp.]